MKFTVKINGVEFLKFKVEDPMEAARLISKLTDASVLCASPGHKSPVRSKVRIAAKGKTIAEMAVITGLRKKQVWGVVNAKGEKERYSKSPNASGKMEFTYKDGTDK